MKKFFLLPFVLTLLLAAVSLAYAQSASLTATVRANPLRVKVFAPSSILADEWFNIEVEVTNLGTESVTKTSVLINSPSKLVIRGKRKRIGDINQDTTETLTWRAKANSVGNYLVLVEVTSKLGEDTISASDSVMILENESLGTFLLKLFFDRLSLLE